MSKEKIEELLNMRHETPATEIFDEIINASKEVWNTKDNTYGYITEKLEIVNSISNYQDNVMISYRMFDCLNQELMRNKLSDEAIEYIEDNE